MLDRTTVETDEIFLNTNELVKKFPTIFTQSGLDYWARKKIGPPFSQPGGRNGIRVYCLSRVIEYLRDPHNKNDTKPKAPETALKLKKKKRNVGSGMASRTPNKKRGPKPSSKNEGGAL